MTGDNIRNMINPIEDQIAPPVLWLNLNHVCYNQISPLALLRVDIKFRAKFLREDRLISQSFREAM
jgi:hypothetical protein